MSEIPFLNALGDAIEAAITDEEPVRARRRSRIWAWRGRGRLVVALAALALGGAAFAATQQNSTTLAISGLACYEGTGTNASAYYDVEANGRSPQAACAHVFDSSGPHALATPGVRLVACADPHGYIAVFQSDSSTRQCQQLGMKPLQSRSYAVAHAAVRTLLRALQAVNPGGGCVTPGTVLAGVRHVLGRLGWHGWRAAIQPRLSNHGACARFMGTGSSISDPAASLDAQHHTVWIITSNR